MSHQPFVRAGDRLEFPNPVILSLERMGLLEGVAVNDFDSPISAHDAARQPDLTVTATADRTDQFVVGNLRKTMQSVRAGCYAVQRCLPSSSRKPVVVHGTVSFSPLRGNCLIFQFPPWTILPCEHSQGHRLRVDDGPARSKWRQLPIQLHCGQLLADEAQVPKLDGT